MINFKPWSILFGFQVNVITILNFSLIHGFPEDTSSMIIFKDIAVHQAFKLKYTFKDHYYQDVEIIANPNINQWLAITLEKHSNRSNLLSLQFFNGKELQQVERDDAQVEIGNCRRIKTFSHYQTTYLITTKCDHDSNKTDLFIVDPQTLSFTKLQTFFHPSVQDSQLWSNIYTQKLNMIIVSRQHRKRQHSESTTTIFHYVFNEDSNKFVKLDKIDTADSLSATVFDIDDKTYVAVSNYRGYSGMFANSLVYFQDEDGKLVKHQEIDSKGVISLTYFCYVGQTKTEHFLLAANNKLLKGPSEMKKAITRDSFVDDSIMFKWTNGYFLPFQTLLVRFPSPWITVQHSHQLILLTWSYTDGIVSYQYDGWRFKRTAIHQQDIVNQDKPTLAHLKSILIGEDVTFTIFSDKSEGKRKHFFIPIFNETTKTRIAYNDKLEWCNHTLPALEQAWKKFKPHSRYLSEINLDNCVTPQDKITFLIDTIFGTDSLKTLYNTGLEIMSQKGVPSDDWMRVSNQQPRQCEITDVKVLQLPDISFMIPLEDAIIALKKPNKIMLYPLTKNKSFNSPLEGIELYYFNNVEKIIKFQLVELCTQKGIYVEGTKGGNFFGKVYIIQHDNTLLLYQTLHIKGESNIKSVCKKSHSKNSFVQVCFIVYPISESKICKLYCNNAVKKFLCNKNIEDSIYWNKSDSIEIDPSTTTNKQFQVANKQINDGIKNSTKTVKILISSSNKIILIDSEDVEICTFNTHTMNSTDCRKINIKPAVYSNVSIGSIQNNICLFFESNNTINIYIVSMDYVMILNLKNKITHQIIEPFTIKNSNFISFINSKKITLIEYKECKP